ncbi:hypothetical protein [Nonomuraea sp. NPDC052265]|uniref:hypothetical protein n=1 Tax=Nonomuraea sp. NPDC052265 TaxID=3364374 RepID=UPI0037CA3E71
MKGSNSALPRAAPGVLRRTLGRLAEALLAAPLVRVYRTPRFDLYVRCSACGGDGITSRGACRACRGFGRVRLS